VGGVPVVCDFRSLDVALGGQGAPLVPLVDKLLFSEYPMCLNLGGFSNLSVLANGSAWDVGPCNLLLNYLANRAGKPFDNGGRIARQGTVHPALLDSLLALPYHRKLPPKSLGTEWLNAEVLPLFHDALAAGTPVSDAMKTATAYIVAFLRPALDERTLVTGGGTHNTFLIEELRSAGATLVVPGKDLVDGKEALAFGLLGLLRLLGEPNILYGTTGASAAAVGGALWGVSSRRET
jgi:anhydro-N-acetylmuramic acid kinase